MASAPCGEHKVIRPSSAPTAEEMSLLDWSVSVGDLGGEETRGVGLSEGKCRTSRHRHTSNTANTSDLPGTISPVSPPSPNKSTSTSVNTNKQTVAQSATRHITSHRGLTFVSDFLLCCQCLQSSSRHLSQHIHTQTLYCVVVTCQYQPADSQTTVMSLTWVQRVCVCVWADLPM
jgi:hypothetical protein